jgi:hypothetical protein
MGHDGGSDTIEACLFAISTRCGALFIMHTEWLSGAVATDRCRHAGTNPTTEAKEGFGWG